ncbi:MAG: hypothetical protein H7327_02620 [Herminiimonas sp.]|nr:hypothetical protein [Herminiimonas sp.]
MRHIALIKEHASPLAAIGWAGMRHPYRNFTWREISGRIARLYEQVIAEAGFLSAAGNTKALRATSPAIPPAPACSLNAVTAIATDVVTPRQSLLPHRLQPGLPD